MADIYHALRRWNISQSATLLGFYSFVFRVHWWCLVQITCLLATYSPNQCQIEIRVAQTCPLLAVSSQGYGYFRFIFVFLFLFLAQFQIFWWRTQRSFHFPPSLRAPVLAHGYDRTSRIELPNASYPALVNLQCRSSSIQICTEITFWSSTPGLWAEGQRPWMKERKYSVTPQEERETAVSELQDIERDVVISVSAVPHPHSQEAIAH